MELAQIQSHNHEIMSRISSLEKLALEFTADGQTEKLQKIYDEIDRLHKEVWSYSKH